MSGLTAWQRWQLASFEAPPAAPPPAPAPAETPVVESDPAESERLRAEAHAAGYAAGYQEGLAAGRQEGYQAGLAEARQEAARLARAAESLERAMGELDQAVGDELLALAIEIARQVVRHELTARPAVIRAVISEALGHLPHQHAVIRLCPSDAALVRSEMGELLAHAGHRIVEEASLAPGDCLLEAGGSQIDAATATRWRRVIEALGLEAAWDIPDEAR